MFIEGRSSQEQFLRALASKNCSLTALLLCIYRTLLNQIVSQIYLVHSFLNLGDTEAAEKHAKWFVPTTRTWSNHTFYSSLSETRSEKERNEIVDLFFKRYEDLVAKAPEEHAMYYVHAYMNIQKVSE